MVRYVFCVCCHSRRRAVGVTSPSNVTSNQEAAVSVLIAETELLLFVAKCRLLSASTPCVVLQSI